MVVNPLAMCKETIPALLKHSLMSFIRTGLDRFWL